MPPRSELFTKCWSTVDLPILPFLAPRLFKPWPTSGRRIHSGSQRCNSQSEITNQRHRECTQRKKRDDVVPLKTTSDLGWNGKNNGNHRPRTSHAWGIQVDENPLELPQELEESHYRNQNSEGDISGSQEFLQKYQEIWGIRESTSNREHEEVAPVQNSLDDNSSNKITNNYSSRTIKNQNDIGIVAKRLALPKKSHISSEATHLQLRPRRTRETRHLLSNTAEVCRRGIPRKSTKWVPLDGAIGLWHRAFARINAGDRGFKLVGDDALQFPESLKKDMILSDSQALRDTWQKMSPESRIQMWPELMIMALSTYPEDALKVLEATYCSPVPPAYAVSDAIEYIISHYMADTMDPKTYSALDLCERIRLLFSSESTNHIHLSQRSIHILLSNLGDEDLRGFYNELVKWKQPIHSNTLMQFGSRFSKFGETDLASEIVAELGSRSVDFSSPGMMSLCTSLLRSSPQGHGGPATNSERFKFMLSHGIRPNVITYNVLIKNAVQAGDPETAWQIYTLMVEHDIDPDGYTYSILLNDAKLRMDPSAIRSVMAHLREKTIRSPHLVTDVLHTILLLHRQEEEASAKRPNLVERRRSAFERMLEVYCEHFDLNSLTHLIPNFEKKYPGKTSNPGVNVDPPGPTLNVMITGLLSELESKDTMDVYQHFHRLSRSGDRIATYLLSTTYIWNIFLLALGKFPESVYDCPKIIGMMIAAKDQSTHLDVATAEPALNSTKPDTLHRHPALENQPLHSVPSASFTATTTSHVNMPQPIKQEPVVKPDRAYLQPDVYTWSILLKIFTDHSLPRAAEKVLSAMQQRNVQPNQVTWNTLMFGYSRAHNTAMVADTVNRMAQAGLEPDEITMKALSNIRDRRGLMDAIHRKEVGVGTIRSHNQPLVGKRFVKSLKQELIQDRPEMAAAVDSNLAAEYSATL